VELESAIPPRGSGDSTKDCLAYALLANSNHCERMLSASATDIALASFMTSDGTQVGKRACFDWCAPLAVCSFHTLASCSPLDVSNTSQLRDLAASAARIFGWDKNDKPGVQLNQQFVISQEQLEQIRQLRAVPEPEQLQERKNNEL
jgi:hypothetical protein